MNRLLTSCMEEGESKLQFANKRASLDLSVSLLGTSLSLVLLGEEDPCKPVNDNRCLLTDQHCQIRRVTTALKSGNVRTPDFLSFCLG